jgi:hypothetical protein
MTYICNQNQKTMKKVMLSVAVVSAMLFTSCDSKKEGEDKKEGTEQKRKKQQHLATM